MPVRKDRKGETIDLKTLRSLFSGIVRGGFDVRLVALERQQAMHGPAGGKKIQGAASGFTLGRGFGRIEGAIEVLDLPLEVVDPKKWQQAVLTKITSDKKVAMSYVKKRFPKVDFRPGRCTTDQDWVSDSICIAEYGRRLLVGKEVAATKE